MDTADLNERDRTALRGQWIGFVFQSSHLLGYRTAAENVALAGLYGGLPASVRAARAPSTSRSSASVTVGTRCP
nr:hypothetical protein [Cellulomonas sp. URHD0024]